MDPNDTPASAEAKKLIRKNQGQLKHIPKNLILWLIFLCLSVILQFIADLVLKGMDFLIETTKIPWRTDFLFLAAISALMGYQALKGLRRSKFEVSRSSIEIGILVEVALIVSDIHFLFVHKTLWPTLIYLRLPFIVFTTLNVFILIFIAQKLQLFKEDHKNHLQIIEDRKKLKLILNC